MNQTIATIKKELRNHTAVPYFSLGIFNNSVTKEGERLPYDSDSLILAMNEGRAMTPRLMYEFSRAAMFLEQKKGVEYMTALINGIYTRPFDPTPLHKAVTAMSPRYIVDTNRDTKLQEMLAYLPHYLVVGRSRIMGDKPRYQIFEYDADNQKYFEIDDEALDCEKTVLFKPMGSPLPSPGFIISDADYVDWLTEAMGGFAVPPALKTYRKAKKYLFLGCAFDRDTERMVANEITLGLEGGWVVTDKELTKKERKFFDQHHLSVLPLSLDAFTELFVS